MRCSLATRTSVRYPVARKSAPGRGPVARATASRVDDADGACERPAPLSVSRRTLLASAPLLATLAAATPPPPLATPKASAAAKKLPKLDPVKLYGSVEAAEASRAAAVDALKATVQDSAAGNLLRFAFHDAGAYDPVSGRGGANGSLLRELERPENGGLKYGAAILANARKAQKESSPGVKPLTDADFIQVAGAVAVEITGGPSIPVALGRPDSKEKGGDPGSQLPANTLNARELSELFNSHGLSTRDMVALSGAHTLGLSRVNDPKGPMVKDYTHFSNDYFKLLLKGGGAFASDRALVAEPETKAIVEEFARDKKKFFKDFSDAYVRMGLIGIDAA